MMSSIVLFLIIGILMGSLAAFLFFQFDKAWSKGLVALTDIVLSGVSAPLFSIWLGLDKEALTLCLIAVYSTTLLSFFGTFYVICQIIKRQNDGLGTIRTTDIILHYDKFLEQYYAERLDQNKLARKSKELDEKERQLSRREEAVQRREEECAERQAGQAAIVLPDNTTVLMTDGRIRMLPRLTQRMCKLSANMQKWTDESIQSGEEGGGHRLSSFLTGVALLIERDLFGVTPTGDVRIHFRVYGNQSYNRFVVFRGGRLVDDSLTPIPAGEQSLIGRSFSLRRSLVASADAEHVFETGSDWGDFLTYSFRNIGEPADHPLLTMGISLKYSEQYQDMLYLLCHCRFEGVIQDCVSRFDREFGVGELMKSDEGKGERVGNMRK